MALLSFASIVFIANKNNNPLREHPTFVRKKWFILVPKRIIKEKNAYYVMAK